VGGRHYCATSQCPTIDGKCTSNPSGSNDGYCHCQRMRVGSVDTAGSWVFLGNWGSASTCSKYCAGNCSNCARSGSHESCSRLALLAL
jgi:hypothetical protein